MNKNVRKSLKDLINEYQDNDVISSIEQDYKAKKYVMLSLTENGWINKTYVSKKDLDENKDNTVFKIIEDSSSYPQTTQKEFAAIAQKKGFKIF